MKAFLKNYKVSIPSAIALLAVAAWLAFGYFAIHTAFIDDEVSEAAPVFVSPAVPATTTTDVAVGVATTPVDTAAPSATAGTPGITAPSTPEVTTEALGSFVSREHNTSGTASVLSNGTGQRFLRFENFETSNGPDLNVYLVNSSTSDVTDYIDLGDLKGNVGDQNYELPVTADLGTYDTVVVWCVRFSVAFGDAKLQTA